MAYDSHARTDSAAASPLRVITSQATSQLLAELAQTYSQHHRPVVVESVGGVEAARRVAAAEPLDIVILAESALAQLAKGGHIRAGSEVPIAQSGIAMAVARGARQPDMHNKQAVYDAVKSAHSVGYSSGASGVYMAQVLAQWGLDGSRPPRIVQSAVGVSIGSHIASGDVELGFQQFSELLPVAGIDIVGMLPADLQLTTVFAGAICATSSQAEAATELLAYLALPETAGSKRRHGLEPLA